MAGRLKILQAGVGTTIQDRGRFASRRFGVTPSGPMDWTTFRSVNHALGNPADAAAIEIAIGGIEVTCEDAPIDIAFGGGAFLWTCNGKPLHPAMRLRLHPGETLRARPGPSGAWAYLAVAGGFDVASEMGSRSTHLRSGIGGRMLQAGDDLEPFGRASAMSESEDRLVMPWLSEGKNPIRILFGPQDDYFTAEARDTFLAQAFTLTASADRMAYRFSGPKLSHVEGFNIVSDGIAPGAIQVGGDGQPLILMADHQPTGGYPKLGYVIRADLGRLAQMRPGETCRFQATTLPDARAALFALEDDIATMIYEKQTIAATHSNQRLRSINLIDGVVAIKP
jgi:biotin-dependent carboxylase-like uncharacterized protein